MSLTALGLAKIAPHCPNPGEVACYLWAAMEPAGITTINRAAGLLGQLALECNQFRDMDDRRTAPPERPG